MLPCDTPEISVRSFVPDDGEGIAELIERNYGTTYYKTFFYDPDAIRRANSNGEIVSIVAAYHESVVGHFAMAPSRFSPIAEIGAAVVDPAFKHLGIMNAMFDRLIASARAKGFCAIYGEGIMLHPFSQKANLHHGMIETALMLGEVPSSIEIEHRLSGAKRSGVLIAYLLFDPSPRPLRLPARYHDIIVSTCQNGNIALQPPQEAHLWEGENGEWRYNPLLRNGTVILHADLTDDAIGTLLETLASYPCDMLFADLNLQRLTQIDRIVAALNRRRFFYCGIMFGLYGGEDYLRLQCKRGEAIDEENLVCHSEFARSLLSFILHDEASV